jgi:hypothetical protein
MKKVLFAVFLVLVCALASMSADPDDQSSWGLIRWLELSGQIASGSGMPAVATAGSRFVDWATPTAPIEYISTGGAWIAISGSGSGGTSTHSSLIGLDFAGSGHTGFASEVAVASHIALYQDPHGATQTITQGLVLGSGTPDTFFYRSATYTMLIASFAALPVVTATPTGTVATGTLWMGTATLYLYVNGAWSVVAP